MDSYSPAAIVVTFAAQILRGYADGSFVTAKRNTEATTLHVGADGRTTVVFSADKSGEITVTLAQSSQSNDILTALYAEQEAGLIPKPIFIKDVLGTTLVSGLEAYIKKLPDIEYGKEVTNREWVFVVGSLKMAVGGSL